MEPMVTAGAWDLAANIPEYHDDRKDPGNVLIRVVLDCTRFILGTHEHVYLHGPKSHGRKNKNAGPSRLRVLFHDKVSFFGDTSQEYSAMCSNP